MIRIRSILLPALLVLIGGVPAKAAETPVKTIAITNVRIFDGTRVIPSGTVVLRGRNIADVGPKVAVPAGAEVIDGAGATLLPGLIDSHTHTWGDALNRAAVFGVTTKPSTCSPIRRSPARCAPSRRRPARRAGPTSTARATWPRLRAATARSTACRCRP